LNLSTPLGGSTSIYGSNESTSLSRTLADTTKMDANINASSTEITSTSAGTLKNINASDTVSAYTNNTATQTSEITSTTVTVTTTTTTTTTPKPIVKHKFKDSIMTDIVQLHFIFLALQNSIL
jgi:hypothetical protein